MTTSKQHSKTKKQPTVTTTTTTTTGWWFGTMEFYFPIILGISSSQLTIRHIFQRGRVGQPPTRLLLTIINHII